MFAQHLIDLITQTLQKNASILSRDEGLLASLQASTFGTTRVSLDAYRKLYYNLFKALTRITTQYNIVQPKLIFAPTPEGSYVNSAEFLHSHPQMQMSTQLGLENGQFLGRFTITAIDSLLNFSRCIPLYSTGVVIETLWDEDNEGNITVAGQFNAVNEENDNAKDNDEDEDATDIKIEAQSEPKSTYSPSPAPKNTYSNGKMRPLYAVVMETSVKAFYTATFNKGAYLNNTKIKPSARTSLSECVMASANFERLFIKKANEAPDEKTKKAAVSFKNLSVYFPNSLGNVPSQLALCYLAAGKIDLFIDFYCTDITEIRAGLMIALEAGICVMDGDGSEIRSIPESYNGIIIAFSRSIKDKVTKIIVPQN